MVGAHWCYQPVVEVEPVNGPLFEKGGSCENLAYGTQREERERRILGGGAACSCFQASGRALQNAPYARIHRTAFTVAGLRV
jgi:hypothetical protein